MTALEFVTEFLIQKIRSIPTETRTTVLKAACYENWADFIVAIQLNRNDLVEWILIELGRWVDGFNFKNNIIDDGFDSGEGDYCVFELDGNIVKVSYSERNPKTGCFEKIEFDFVERKEILIPKTFWSIIN